MTQAEKALRLLELHRGTDPLVLVNAWDAASARIVEQAGFPAIATSSAALANSLGYADGQNVPWAEMALTIQKIAELVHVPVTADIEAGFSADLKQLERIIEDLMTAGAVGMNFEDAIPGYKFGPLYPVEEQVARIRSVRKTGETRNIHLVINARTDAYWQQGVKPEEALRNTLERGKAYLQAGADCVFIPGLKDADTIRKVVGELRGPVNILAIAGAPSITELKEMGVKRVSMGSGPMRAAMGLLRRIAHEARDHGTYKLMVDEPVPYPELNSLFEEFGN
jgi:2-methylisocitrate lyase-like PEP mutase family enzyme